MDRLRRKKPTLAELRMKQLRQVRLAAPTLRTLQPRRGLGFGGTRV